MSNRDNDGFWADVENALHHPPTHLAHRAWDPKAIERLREFVEKQDDSDLFFHLSPKRIAEGILNGGYRTLEASTQSLPHEVRSYLDRP